MYDNAYIAKDGGLAEVETDFACYIDSLLENRNITANLEDTDAVAIFQKYGWTVEYQISAMNKKRDNINALSGFNPNAYYFAYNNELSKDIGLDMSGYSNTTDIYSIILWEKNIHLLKGEMCILNWIPLQEFRFKD